jgi:ATP-dependent DNA helicase RecQ
MSALQGAVAFRQLQALLRGDPPGPDDAYDNPAFERLAGAISRRGLTDEPTGRDLVGLIRHALRTHGIVVGGSPSLDVPAALLGGMGVDEVERVGLKAIKRDGFLRVYANPWSPAWLPNVPQLGVDHSAAAAEIRRKPAAVPADPFFVASLGYSEYRSPAQRAAVRAVVDAPPGSTLALILPTGEGKSACFYTAATVGWKDRGGLPGTVVVITPTVALALDQERVAREYGFEVPYLAYRQSDPEARRDMIERLENGTQEICFISPEAALDPLVSALRKASERGYLTAFVVDEAHLVDAWGGVFRPDFQFLAGLRQELLARAPSPRFRTLLLTATLTESAAFVLRALFGEPGAPLPIVAAPSMRPEHDYWTTGIIPDEDVRDRYLDEAVDCLPRPLIVYTTERADAQRQFERLRNRGYNRIGWMSGESSTVERRHLLQRWSAGTCDIVVATSAFGLGVSYSRVRTVVHACVPEGIDRFYQEVGRSGRDGRAAISLVLPTPDDLRTAQGLAGQKLITIAKGLPRWASMFRSGTFKEVRGGEDVVELTFDLAPGVDPDRIDMRNEQNTNWNLRVLALMAISGLVALREAPRGLKQPDGTFKEVLNVVLRDRGHLTEAAWSTRVEPHRARVGTAGRRSMALMSAYLEGRTCIARAVEHQYSVPANALGAAARIQFEATCPGCPSCRANGTLPGGRSRQSSPPHPWPPTAVPPKVAGWLDPGHRLVVRYSAPLFPADEIEGRRRMTALARLLDGLVRSVRLDPSSGLTPDQLQQVMPNWPIFTSVDLAGGGLPPGPTAMIWGGRVPLEFLYPRPSDQPVIAFAEGVDERYDGLVWPIGLLETLLLR